MSFLGFLEVLEVLIGKVREARRAWIKQSLDQVTKPYRKPTDPSATHVSHRPCAKGENDYVRRASNTSVLSGTSDQ